MAAILALVFVPALAATLVMLGTAHDGLSVASGVAAATFVALVAGLLVGLMRLARAWDRA